MKHNDTATAARGRLLRARTLAVSTAVLFLPQAMAGSLASAAPLETSDQEPRGVAAVTYNLGDQAYRLPGSGEPVEIAATVHYPKPWPYRGTRRRDRKPQRVSFSHHIDLNKVGTMGHSRGGAGVTWQAADRHKAQWPAGVKVRAVMALAPAYNVMTEDMSAYEITKTPMAVIRGTCDGQVGRDAFSFAADATARSSAGFHKVEIHGANHNYFNTQWSPDSGEVAADDDAGHDDDHPGQCTEPGGSTYEPQLTEARQRQVGTAHIDAFFRRYLTERQADPGSAASRGALRAQSGPRP